ncbi:acyltransferase [Flammeovirga sp. MY04]|uniref:acyltransferase n=1 Tax=Flammeovirga sp. MY04 TaxID=1191459 RepID=UPI0008060A15|nr:acyltransferase [Flammeovirga sp. MY04]ANQ48429.1 acyltransferase [Flammeovirga sp. MY04]
MPFLSIKEIEQIGFKFYGENIQISDKAVFYNPSKISIGNNSRIDDYCILSAGNEGIFIGDFVHIACFSSLIGKGKITMQDFSGLSSRVSVYSSNDDYSGTFLTNPTVNEEFTNVSSGPVLIKKHVIVGSGSVILPNITLNTGVAVGALSLINKDCEDFSIYIGNPAKKIKNRKKDLLKIEQKFKELL